MASESSLTNWVDVTVKGRYGVILYLFQTRIYMLFADREVRIGTDLGRQITCLFFSFWKIAL